MATLYSTFSATFRYFSEAMIRRATFLISSIASLCITVANPLHAKTTSSSDDNAVRQLRNFRDMLSVQVARGASDPTLPGYFQRVAQAYRKAGYPGIGHVLELSGASELTKLAGQFTGRITSLDSGNTFTERLKSAIGVAESANAPLRLDYLMAAKRFQGGFSSILGSLESRRAMDAATSHPASGTYHFSKPNSTFTFSSNVSTSTWTTPTYTSGAVTINAGELTVVNSNYIGATFTDGHLLSGTATINSINSTLSYGNLTVDASATLVISSGASIDISSSSTFTLLGTLSLDLASSVVPINGTSTSTYDLETGATLNVKNPAPGTYTILSGFQSTGNTLGDVTITGLASGQTGVLSEVNGTVTLTITVGP